MRVVLATALMLTSPVLGSVAAQRALRDSAFAVHAQGNHREALTLFERLVAIDSTDPAVQGRLGMLLLEFAGALPDSAARRAQRVRARGALLRAARLGSRDVQVLAIGRLLPEDGGPDAVFSERPEVQDAMRRGEAAYRDRDMAAARRAYLEALSLDPGQYEAAVFIGDSFLPGDEVDSAYAWYHRATEMAPDRELAWRYWSDILGKHGAVDEARDRMIEAMVAEPYSPMTRQGLIRWAEIAKVRLGFPRLQLPRADSTQPASPARLAYDSVRAAWRDVDGARSAAFAAAYPGESAYRRSLAEELDALRAAGRAGGDDPRTRNIVVLDSLGLLEPFVLIAGADAGVAQDYPAYRAAHREALRRFWREIVIGATMSQ